MAKTLSGLPGHGQSYGAGNFRGYKHIMSEARSLNVTEKRRRHKERRNGGIDEDGLDKHYPYPKEPYTKKERNEPFLTNDMQMRPFYDGTLEGTLRNARELDSKRGGLGPMKTRTLHRILKPEIDVSIQNDFRRWRNSEWGELPLDVQNIIASKVKGLPDNDVYQEVEGYVPTYKLFEGGEGEGEGIAKQGRVGNRRNSKAIVSRLIAVAVKRARSRH